jgi:hypothetical protein
MTLACRGWKKADPEDWRIRVDRSEVTIQTLHQQAGCVTTLLRFMPADDDPDDDIDDAYEHFSHFDAD